MSKAGGGGRPVRAEAEEMVRYPLGDVRNRDEVLDLLSHLFSLLYFISRNNSHSLFGGLSRPARGRERAKNQFREKLKNKIES